MAEAHTHHCFGWSIFFSTKFNFEDLTESDTHQNSIGSQLNGGEISEGGIWHTQSHHMTEKLRKGGDTLAECT
jgi:hypothetical protein